MKHRFPRKYKKRCKRLGISLPYVMSIKNNTTAYIDAAIFGEQKFYRK